MIEFLTNSSLLVVLVIVIASILGLGLVIFAVFSLFKGRDNVSSRLEQIEAPIPQTTNTLEAQIIGREISGSLVSRTLVNWGNQILRFLGKFTPANSIADLEHKLDIAGNPNNLQARQFYALRFLLLLGGIFIAFFLNRDLSTINSTTLLLSILVIFLFYALPEVWLKGRIRTRQEEIQRGLPDALDMLAVCASAGLGFDQSLQKISNYWDTELGNEFKIVTTEMELGTSRSVALKNMSNRLDVNDLTQFIAIITQAEKIGMSYADVLESQAMQMRIMRQHRVREVVNKLPAKMIIPLALLIFPAILAVILVPLIPTLMGIFQ